MIFPGEFSPILDCVGKTLRSFRNNKKLFFFNFIEPLLIAAPFVCGDLCLVFVLFSCNLCYFYFCNHLDGEARAGCFTLIVFLMHCDC